MGSTYRTGKTKTKKNKDRERRWVNRKLRRAEGGKGRRISPVGEEVASWF